MKKSNLVLSIRDFPEDLAEMILAESREVTLSKAALFCLLRYFELKTSCARYKLKAQDLQSDLDKILLFWKHQEDLSREKSEVEKLLSDPNRFYLHGD